MNDDISTIELAKKLIEKPSITPNDADCQNLLISYLEPLGFKIERFKFGEVENLWAKRGNSKPLFIFAGHTDVVPPGPLERWQSNPFQPEIRAGKLYGRGATDMKSSIAAMIIACTRFIKKNPQHVGSIAFLITSDEEGTALDGTAKVIAALQQRQEKIDYCLIGEASSEKQLGDTIKIGRRGSLHGKLIIQGKQGHIAYPQLAENPIHKAAAALDDLCKVQWDTGSKEFPPTSFQISNIHAGTGADNVIPAELSVTFNLRYSNSIPIEEIQQRINSILNQHQLSYHIEWRVSGKPFLSPLQELVTATTQAVTEITGITPQLSTSGGTSDGRFIAATGCQIVELGPINQSAHQINEHVIVADLEKLSKIYQRILELLLL